MANHIEHKPWIIPDKYAIGIEGQQIAIVGHSHWRDPGDPKDKDSDNYTLDVLGCVLANKVRSFFPHIRGYFDGSTTDFWNHVMFFNYLPECLTDRYDDGEAQLPRARQRFDNLLDRWQPDKVFVFTQKGWPRFPIDNREQLGPDFPLHFTWGTHGTSKRRTMVFGLRHPQGANGDLMKRAVREILQRPTSS